MGAGSIPADGSTMLLSQGSDHLTHGLTSRLWLRVEWQGILTCPHNLRTHRRPHNPYTGLHNSPGRMCVNQPAWKRAGFYFVICRLSAIWSAARVCRHGWFNSKGGFLYSRSSIGRALVSKTRGCRLGPCRECHFESCRQDAQIAGHLAAEVPNAAALHPFYVVRETECIPGALLILIFCRPSGRLLFCREVSRWREKRKQWIFLPST